MRNFRIEKLAGFMRLADDLSDINDKIKKIYDDAKEWITKSHFHMKKETAENHIDDAFNYENFKSELSSDAQRKILDNQKNAIWYPAVTDLKSYVKSLSYSNYTPAAAAAAPNKNKPSAAQTTAKSLIINYPIRTKLQDSKYIYKIDDPNSKFSWIQKNTDPPVSGDFELSKFGIAKWNKAVAKLNDPNLTTVISTSQVASSTATPAATTAPAATPEAATQATAEVPTDTLSTNVARILSNVDAGQTYAGRTPFTNEMGMVRNMLRAINAIADQRKVVIDAPLSLAKIIVGANRSSLGKSVLSTYDSTALTSMREGQIEKTFRAELDIIMRSIASFDQRLGGKRNYDKISGYINLRTPAVPATPPAEKKASSSFNKKIIKAATLRRLKIRSQMEAAIDSSAQMGRARVY